MSPAISVVVPAETADSIRPLLSHLRRQTVAERIELIVVAPSGAPLELEESATAAFAAARTLTIPAAELTDLPLARAAGVRSAAAPIVAFTETHCFAEPGWAEALIAAHEGPWAAVGPAFVNGNPGTAVSWSNLLIDYGPWIEPVKAGPVRDLPGHNSSYDTAELRAYGERLEAMLAAEFVMHDEMRSRGRALYLEPAARTRHHNVTRLGSWLPERFHAGRAFAAARCRGWGPARRLLYIAGSPLIPVVRLTRLGPVVRRVRPPDPIKVTAALVLGLAANAIGELFGFALGSGRSVERTARMELYRFEHVRRPERTPAGA